MYAPDQITKEIPFPGQRNGDVSSFSASLLFTNQKFSSLIISYSHRLSVVYSLQMINKLNFLLPVNVNFLHFKQ